MVGCPRFDGRSLHAEPPVCLVERGVCTVHDHVGRDSLDSGSIDDLVVDVGDVANVRHLVARPLEVPTDHIEDHCGPAMAEVWVRLDRRPAHVHSDLAGVTGLQLLEFATERVVDLHQERWYRRAVPQRCS